MPVLICRWTVNCIPDEVTSAAVVAYADNPNFDEILKGYRVGSGHGTKQFSFPHATSVHFEGTIEDFNVVLEFIKNWCIANPQAICAKLLNTKPILINIPLGHTSYSTTRKHSSKETCWINFNLEKEPFMALHTAVIGFLTELNKSKDYKIKIISTILENHCPHFTVLRVDAEAATRIDFPAINLPEDHIVKFTVSAGPSHKSGEYPVVLYLFDTERSVDATERLKLKV